MSHIPPDAVAEQLLAAVDSAFRERISLRTKAALQAAKRRGTLLGSARPGCWDGREHLRLAGLQKAIAQSVKSRREAFVSSYLDLLPIIQELRAAGRTLRQIAETLNEQGHSTRRGCRWNQTQVWRVLRGMQ